MHQQKHQQMTDGKDFEAVLVVMKQCQGSNVAAAVAAAVTAAVTASVSAAECVRGDDGVCVVRVDGPDGVPCMLL